MDRIEQIKEILRKNSEWYSLKSERFDEVAQQISALFEPLESELKRVKSLTWCAYCGTELPLDTVTAEQVGEHIKTCEKHPLYQANKRIKELEAQITTSEPLDLKDLREEIAKHPAIKLWLSYQVGVFPDLTALDVADQILSLISAELAKRKIVELDKKQKLPVNPISQPPNYRRGFSELYDAMADSYDEAQQDMLKAGFRKVKNV